MENEFLLKGFVREYKLKNPIKEIPQTNNKKIFEECPNCNFKFYGYSQNEIAESKRLHFTLKHSGKNRSRYQPETFRK